MAKEHVAGQLNIFRSIGVEESISATCVKLSKQFESLYADYTFYVALNLAGDLKGGWTNRYTSDLQSRFEINALVRRRFITPFLGTSETITGRVTRRTEEACRRAIYRLKNKRPLTLGEYFTQECFALIPDSTSSSLSEIQKSEIEIFLELYHESEDSQVILNFFYGESACHSLNLKIIAPLPEMAGLEFARCGN